MKIIRKRELLTKRDVQIAWVTPCDQVRLLNRAMVAQHLPYNVTLLLLVEKGEDSELWARGRKAEVERVRSFFLGWRAALRNAAITVDSEGVLSEPVKKA